MAKKPEQKQHRTPADIQAEYGQVCAQIGDLTYRLEVGIPRAVAELKAKLEALNLEHAAALAADKESKSNG